jgi:hypothetical protein
MSGFEMFPSRGRWREKETWPRDKLLQQRSIAIKNSVSRSTSEAYDTAFKAYSNFCSAHGYPINPTPETLSIFVSYYSAYVSPRTVNSYLSGVCLALEGDFPSVREARKSSLVMRTLSGCARMRNKPVNRKRALTVSEIDNVFVSLPFPLSFDDCLFLAILSTGFYSLQRLGELVKPDSQSRSNTRSIPLRWTVRQHHDFFEYLLPSHKADPTFDGSKIILQRIPDRKSCPFLAFSRYLSARDRAFPYHPFLWLRSDGTQPNRSWFIHRLRVWFGNDVAGHSLRSGGATALALAGVSFDRIQAIGRWSSEAFKIYIRTHPVLLQTHIDDHGVFQGHDTARSGIRPSAARSRGNHSSR